MTTAKQSFVAVVRGHSGGGSYYRHHDKQEAAKKAVKQFAADFKHIYGKLKKGAEVPVNIYDCTDKDVVIGEDGVWEKSANGGRGVRVPQLEVLTITH